MRNIRSLTGMPVLVNGKKFARLIQAELSGDLRQLRGIWVDAGLHGTRFIPAEQLGMIGQMAVTADSRGIRKRCKTRFALRRALSTGGHRLGAITGVEIDEVTFEICALELSSGLWEDLYRGRHCISEYSVHPQSGDVILRDSAENSKEDES